MCLFGGVCERPGAISEFGLPELLLPTLQLVLKKRSPKEKGSLPKTSNTLKLGSFFPRLGLHRHTQDRAIRTYMERAEENYLMLPFTAQYLPTVENPGRNKAQTGFIMTQEE